jgi:hypothetical protein
MAAHGLTILRQIADHIVRFPDTACSYALAATDAPGTCVSAGFSMHTWAGLEAAGLDKSLTYLNEVVKMGIERHEWMSKFRNLEEVREFLMSNAQEGA